MKLPFGWTAETLGDIVQFGGVGLMALGVGIQYNLTGAIAVFALGLPILTIQRHMRERHVMDCMTLDALIQVRRALQSQQEGEKLALEVVRDINALLKRIADEGITRD